jgi:asparagine synthase (glutamine-hydrolysing)
MQLPGATTTITFNGEIYNYRELQAQLRERGRKFSTSSDTEVLLHLYDEYGDRMFGMLRGMYSIAIWDDQDKSLLLARDPFGIKPLYYANTGDYFVFASQVKALLHFPEVDLSPQAAGHVGFFLWGHVPEPHTLHRGIHAVPAGSIVRVLPDFTLRNSTLFSIREECATAHAMNIDADEASESFAEALRESVAFHLVSDVPAGVFLSSGLDSTTLASLASEIKRDVLQTFTLGFSEYVGTPLDESALAAEVAEGLATNHLTSWISKSDFESSLEHLFRAMDQPSTDGVNSYFVSQAASRGGLKVAISGVGGDELLGGYPSFHQIPAMVRVLQVLSGCPRLGRYFRLASSPIVNKFTSPKYAGLIEFGGRYEGAYLLRRGMYMPWELPDIMDPDMARQGWKDLNAIPVLGAAISAGMCDFQKVQALELSFYMRNQLLRDTDWASMAHSLEVRLPLVDVPLFRRLCSLRNSGHRMSKFDMARTPANPLPAAVLAKHKSGFSIPVHSWLGRFSSPTSSGRGLRGWARHVYSTFASASPTSRLAQLRVPDERT